LNTFYSEEKIISKSLNADITTTNIKVSDMRNWETLGLMNPEKLNEEAEIIFRFKAKKKIKKIKLFLLGRRKRESDKFEIFYSTDDFIKKSIKVKPPSVIDEYYRPIIREMKLAKPASVFQIKVILKATGKHTDNASLNTIAVECE
jgi:hypothetical protein